MVEIAEQPMQEGLSTDPMTQAALFERIIERDQRSQCIGIEQSDAKINRVAASKIKATGPTFLSDN